MPLIPHMSGDRGLSAFSGWFGSWLLVPRPRCSNDFVEVTAEKSRLGGRIPGDLARLWDWCLARSRDELLEILAVLAAYSVDAVRQKGDRPDSDRLVHGEALARAVSLHMTAWYTPTAGGYFNRVRRSQIMAA